VDDVLHEAIELLMQQNEQFEKLRTAIDLGTQDIRAGRVVDGEAVFEEMQARIERNFSITAGKAIMEEGGCQTSQNLV
jgi:predicted transcriptional regulator